MYLLLGSVADPVPASTYPRTALGESDSGQQISPARPDSAEILTHQVSQNFRVPRHVGQAGNLTPVVEWQR